MSEKGSIDPAVGSVAATASNTEKGSDVYVFLPSSKLSTVSEGEPPGLWWLATVRSFDAEGHANVYSRSGKYYCGVDFANLMIAPKAFEVITD